MFSNLLTSALFASVVLVAPGVAGVQVQIHPNGNTNMCVDVTDNNQESGTLIQIYECNNTGAQNWLMNTNNTKIQLANSNFCLDASANYGDHVQMTVQVCVDDIPSQSWDYSLPDNKISLVETGQCLDNRVGQMTNGNPVQTYHCNVGVDNPAQIWTTTPPLS